MKYIVLILFSIMVFSAAGYCQDSGKIYWGGATPSSVAAKANNMQYGSGSGGGSYNVPVGGMDFNPAMGMMNSMLMMQNGTMADPYQMQQMQRQQFDYTKQQMKDMEALNKEEAKEDAQNVKPVKAIKHTQAKVLDEGEENFNTEW